MNDALIEPDGPSAANWATDDVVIAFRTVRSGISGRVVRLAGTVNETLTRHNYPEPVSHVLGEALALAALLGSQLKFDGRLILQTKSDGPIGFLVVNYDTAGTMRGYASFDAERLAGPPPAAIGDAQPKAIAQRWTEGALLGSGHLAMTIDPAGDAGDMERTQGIVAMGGGTLSDAAHEYFRASEQLPTFIKLSVARHFAGGVWHWRAGGLMVQHVTSEGGTPLAKPTTDTHTDDDLLGTDDDNWRRVEMLARTVEDHELLDPLLTPDQLLYRLFHEEGVRASEPTPVKMACRCSRDAVGVFLKSFGMRQLTDMRDADGSVTVTCEFCTTPYRFTETDLGA